MEPRSGDKAPGGGWSLTMSQQRAMLSQTWTRQCPHCRTPIYNVLPWDEWKCLGCGWTGK